MNNHNDIRMRPIHFIPVIVVLSFLFFSAAHAQFGGRSGDAVFYLVTAKGSGIFQTVLSPGINDPQATARFHVTPLAIVPQEPSDPFPLLRQTLYDQPDETFLVGTDSEGGRGIHRLILVPVKDFVREGLVSIPGGNAITGMYINFPPGIDAEGDAALLDTKFLFWAPKGWPFLQPTEVRGPAVPAGQTGFGLLLTTPGLVSVASLKPWTPFQSVYPGSGWPAGVDMKILDENPEVGDTIRMIRIRPGKSTPVFRIPGHTHVFTLQGSATIAPAGSAPITVKVDDYAFLPENIAVTIANPAQYQGPGAP
jgi:hypothetical protein